MNRLPFPVQRKVSVAIFGAIGASLVLVALSLGLYEYRAAEPRLRATLEILAEATLAQVAPAVEFGVPAAAQEAIARLEAGHFVAAATVLRPGGAEPFARHICTGQTPRFAPTARPDGFHVEGDRALLVTTLARDGRPVATLQLEGSLGAVRRGFGRSLLMLAGILAAMLGVGALLARLLARAITLPVTALAETTRAVRRTGDYGLRAEIRSRDELGELAGEVNGMLAAIQERDRTIAAAAAWRAAILAGTDVAVISVRLDGVVESFNPAAERLTGLAAADVIGRLTPLEWHDPEEMRICADELSRRLGRPVSPDMGVFTTGIDVEGVNRREWTFVRRDGTRVPVLLVISRLTDGTGATLGYVGAATDLTERKAAEAALRESEDRYRKLAENALVGLVVVQDGVIRYANARVVALMGGAASGELIGRDPAEFVAPAVRGEMHARVRRALAGEIQPLHPGYQLLRPDGTAVWVQSGSSPTRWNGLPAVQVFLIDVTDRVQAEHALRASEERHRVIIEQTGQMVYDLDIVTGRNEWFGASAVEAITGYTLAEFETVTFSGWSELIHPDDRAAALAEFDRCLATGERYDVTYRFRRKDGGYRFVSDLGVFVKGEGPGYVRMFGAMADITERRSAEEQRTRAAAEILALNAALERRVAERTLELAQRVEEVERLNAEQHTLLAELRTSHEATDRAAAQLQEVNGSLLAANQELEAFSYSVSHDLRAPLRNIGGFMELLGRRAGAALDPESQRYVTIVGNEARRMGLLIDDLLTFSRIGRTEMKPEPVRLADLIDEVRLELATELAGRSIAWRIEPLPPVQGDRALLRQVVANLVGNAVKFTRRREHAVIEIGAAPCRHDDPMATFYVRDNGAGFNPRYLDKLFGVFQRLHNARDFEGTGIGLANVKRIVVRHGGRVWAEGAVDKGATFYFALPLRTP